jgi:hypothetical protein
MLFVFCFNVSAGFNRPKYSFYFNTFITRKFAKSKFISEYLVPSIKYQDFQPIIKHQKQLIKLLLVTIKQQCLAT